MDYRGLITAFPTLPHTVNSGALLERLHLSYACTMCDPDMKLT